MAAIAITVHDSHPPAETALVDGGLGASNEAAAPMHEVQPLSCFAKSESGDVLGGAIGRRWGPCCELQQLWVDPAHRHEGVATRLIREFEAHARSGIFGQLQRVPRDHLGVLGANFRRVELEIDDGPEFAGGWVRAKFHVLAFLTIRGFPVVGVARAVDRGICRLGVRHRVLAATRQCRGTEDQENQFVL